MYIKWIVCKVKAGMQEEFSDSQGKWKETKRAPGFIAQAGGWNADNENEACIIAFWEGKEYLDKFMIDLHDKILEDNRQADTYNSVNAVYFNKMMDMEGEANSLTEAVEKSRLLRIADCIVKQNKIRHFERMQNEIWFPGMKKSKGMLGGTFSRDNNSRYLVSTFWDSIEDHTDYEVNSLPEFRIRASIDNDINKITGKKILVVDSWKV